MRRGAVLAALTGTMTPLAMIAPALVVGGSGPTRHVEYAGYRVQVPSTWPVYRLDEDPGRCVRFDRHAVYLGRPGADQRCPAHLVGRTEALLVQPLDAPESVEARGETVQVRTETASVRAAPAAPSREVRLGVEGAGVLVTATYGSDKATIDRVLASATLTPRARPSTVRMTLASASAPAMEPATVTKAKRHRHWTGRGFDTCHAPSLASMRAWRDSPYGAVGIYLGGANRSCPDGNLSESWIDHVRAMGWRLIPIYVSLQAPCAYHHGLASISSSPSRATKQGRAAAAHAASNAGRRGIGKGSPIYLDIEAYDSRNARCRNAVLHFAGGWTRKLHDEGYRSGVYGTVTRVIRDLGRAGDHITRPDNIWYAHWDGVPRVATDRYLRDAWWEKNHLMKQYRGGHGERHGGVRINIDSNMVDADVA